MRTSPVGGNRVFDIVPVLQAGSWETVETSQTEEVFNPSTGKPIARVPLCGGEHVDTVVESAAIALPRWREVSVIDRARLMFRFHTLLERHFDELAELVTREHGKTIAESRAEVQRGLEMVEFAAGIPSIISGETLAEIAPNVDAESTRHPVGVCVGITPYNFPAMIPLWMFPVALVCGNTFVLKPSEKVPLSSVRLGELLLESGIPDGVFNIIHGSRACVDCLLRHECVAAVSFVGSSSVARHVHQLASENGKRVQAAGGAKNHMIVMPDADTSLAVPALAASAYGCAGQRCMAGSVAVAVGETADRVVGELCEFAGNMKVGPTDGNDQVELGPLIRAQHRQRVAGYLDTAKQEGASIRLDGRCDFPSEAFLLGPCVVDHVRPDMKLARDEVFGPVLAVIRADNLEAALAIGDTCQYGNGASIFTNNGYAARQFKHRFNAGMIGINVAVPAPMAWFPFTGWNRSFLGDLHIQGKDSVRFYTRQKVTLTRWFASTNELHHDPVWKSD